jgi:hypothetical protein
MNTPELIQHLQPNEIFVFGSNQFARHGAGSALAAMKFGAINGDVPMGLCGQTYGIVTTSFNDEPVTLEFIKAQVSVLYQFAALRSELTFLVTKIGTGIAGFTVKEIAGVFKSMSFKPNNIILPIEFI